MRQRFDVLVAGGGPAGSSAAITSRRAGLSVAVIDRSTFPRDKCCGDGLTAAALRRLEGLGLDPAEVPSWEPVRRAAVVGAGGRTLDLDLRPSGVPGLFAASARRRDLDAALVGLAVRSGAAVFEGEAVCAVEPTSRGVAVETSSGRTLTAGYLVAADGMWSPVRRLLGAGAPGYLGEWQAGRQYLRTTEPLARRLWVWFEPDMIPGYAWSFPLAGGLVNVGYGVVRPIVDGSVPLPGDGNRTLRGQGVDWRSRPRIARVLGDFEEAGPWRSWPIPARIGTARLQALGGRVLFAGDAAGACDPMTGEGIAQALETGAMAARAAAGAGPDRAAQAGRRYATRVRTGMAVDHRLSQFFSGILARPGGSDRALGVADSSERARRQFTRWMFEDYPRAAPLTPYRWRRGMASGEGAFRAAWPPVGREDPGSTIFPVHD